MVQPVRQVVFLVHRLAIYYRLLESGMVGNSAWSHHLALLFGRSIKVNINTEEVN